jgi:hypothetical protein
MAGKRMLHETICISEKINALDEGSENLYYRILSKSDDFGRYYGRPEIVKGFCYPLKNDITTEIVAERLKKLTKIGLFLKISDEVIEICDFNRHQKFRKDIKKKSHFRKAKPVTGSERVVTGSDENVAISKVKLSKDKISKVNSDTPACAGTPQAEFVDNWKALYKAKTGKEYKASQKDYVLAANLLKDFSQDEILEKIKILFELCNSKGVWFAKSMADFTIGKLSSRWNEILEEIKDNGRQAGVSKSEFESFVAGRK